MLRDNIMIDKDTIYKKYEPKYCPNCGAKIDDNCAIYNKDTISEYDWGYDSYCGVCEWSGDIFPDSLLFEMEDYLEDGKNIEYYISLLCSEHFYA